MRGKGGASKWPSEEAIFHVFMKNSTASHELAFGNETTHFRSGPLEKKANGPLKCERPS